jgi:phage shock protein A
MFIARARSAAASQRLQEMMGRGGPIAAFEQMEQRILDLEARAQALGELNADPLEQRFAALEGSPPSVDSELALLKQRINP